MSSRARPARNSATAEALPPFGVVAYPDGADIEALLADFVASLQAAGVAIGGLLQRSTREANGRPRMELRDIGSGTTLLISQNLGTDSTSCCVDPQGVATAAGYLRRAIAAKPDLLVINKFSGLEAKGGGLRAEFLEALAQGLPLLTGLSERHREAFEEMTGGAGVYLEADAAYLAQWWSAVTGEN